MDLMIRPLLSAEYSLLDDFLYLSIFQPEGREPLPRSIIFEPKLRIYTEGFGTDKDDYSLCAEVNAKIAGIVWARNIDAYGSIDARTPELAIAVLPAFRGQGIGYALLLRMLESLEAAGYQACSLSVQKLNRAHKLYFQLGFEIYREDEEEYILVRRFNHEPE